MDKEKSINNFSIVAFILSFVIFPVGLILSIIGLARCKGYKNETGKNPSHFAFNIVGIVVSVISLLITISIIGFIVLICGIVSSNDSKILGSYTCNYRYSSKPALTATFRDGKFSWAKYNDSLNNEIRGTYRIKSREVDNGKYTYKLRLRPNKYNLSSNTTISTKTYYDITIEKNSYNVTITFDNGTTYKCTKGISNNEF